MELRDHKIRLSLHSVTMESVMQKSSSSSSKSTSRTWITGCFASALVGLGTALCEAPFHQTSAVELGVVSGICFLLALVGWFLTTSQSAISSYESESSLSTSQKMNTIATAEV